MHVITPEMRETVNDIHKVCGYSFAARFKVLDEMLLSPAAMCKRKIVCFDITI